MNTLLSVLIENYRSIKHISTALHRNLNFIVGLNGNGKSNFLRAINCLLTGEKLSVEDLHMENEMLSILIECRFTNNVFRRVFSTKSDLFFIDGKKESKSAFLKKINEEILISPIYFIRQNRVNELLNSSPTELYGILEEASSYTYIMDNILNVRDRLNGANEDITLINSHLKDMKNYLKRVEAENRAYQQINEAQIELVNLNNILYMDELKRYRHMLQEMNERREERSSKSDRLAYLNKELMKHTLIDEPVDEKYKNIVRRRAALQNSINDIRHSLNQIENERCTFEIQQKLLMKKMSNLSKKELKNRLKILKSSGNSKKEDIDILIAQRKEMWREENRLKNLLKEERRKLRMMGRYLHVQGENTLFSFLKFDKSILPALSAVGGKLLFSYIVNRREEATALLNKLKREGNFTQSVICLEQVHFSPIEFVDDNLIRLSSLISLNENIDEKYAIIIELLCNNYYLVQDINIGYHVLNKINDRRLKIITLNGVKLQRGILSCQINKFDLPAYFTLKNSIEERTVEIEKGERAIEKLNKDIEMAGEGDQKEEILSLEIQLKYFDHPHLLKEENFEQKFSHLRLMEEQRKERLNGLLKEEERVEEIYLHLQKKCEIYGNYKKMEDEKQFLEKSLQTKIGAKVNLEENIFKNKIYSIRNKIDLLKQKIGNVKVEIPSSLLAIKERKEEIEKFLQKKEIPIKWKEGQYDDLHQKYENMREGKEQLLTLHRKIMLFIKKLEERGNSDLDIFIEKFKVAYERHKELVPCESTLSIENKQILYKEQYRSGGEKALLSTLLLLALELISSSKIILLDEIDSAIDRKNSAIIHKFFQLLKQSGKQIVAITFNKDLLIGGDSFIHIKKGEAEILLMTEAEKILN